MNVARVPGRPSLAERLLGSPYQAYLYGYPHKTAYRRFEEPIPLEALWAGEDRRHLFLYVHVPFCEMRCGFCNLFTAANPVEQVVDGYLRQLEVEAAAVAGALGAAGFAAAAVGGGTPTFLEASQLERLFDVMERLGAPLGRIPLSVELSPETTTPTRVEVLRRRGADRVSIGVQSFVEAEAAALKRPQRREEVLRALDLLKSRGFATLNVDLIYGAVGQTEATFETSLREALRFAPEELYLYPLYVRPLTLLGKGEALPQRAWDEQRLALYRHARGLLLAEGYAQVSMRMFRRRDAARLHPLPADGEGYACQRDGMVGLGCGARSYTKGVHYSQEFAVQSRAVRGIIDAYNARPADSFEHAHWGFRLDGAEQRRRHAILSLLAGGIDEAAFVERFGAAPFDALPELAELEPNGLARREPGRLSLTPLGVERSDVIGPWLHSAPVDGLMSAWEQR